MTAESVAISSFMPNVRRCGFCQISEIDRKLQNCSQCLCIQYCSLDCQKAHWLFHKQLCEGLAKTSNLQKIQSASGFTYQSSPSSAAIAEKIVEPLDQELDKGLLEVLAGCRDCFEMAEHERDEYSILLRPLIFDYSEKEAIDCINHLDDDTAYVLIINCCHASTNQKEKGGFLNLLRLSALQRRFSLLKCLFERIKSLKILYKTNDHLDQFGWNLAHFVALHATKGKFPETGIAEIDGLIDKKNKAGATPRDFAFWLSEPSSKSISAFGPDKPSLSNLDFRTLMGRDFWIRPKFSPQALLSTYFEASTVESQGYLGTVLHQKINLYIKDLENGIYIPKMKARKIENPHVSMQGQWECQTTCYVEKGGVIGLYSGTVKHHIWNTSHVGNKAHRITDSLLVDADCGGNLTELINHGFPNCACYPHSYRGFAFLVMIALEPIQAGTTLYFNYSAQYFETFGIPCITLNQEGIDDYLRKTDNIKNIPAIQIDPDGFGYSSIDKAELVSKRKPIKIPLSFAVDAWANQNKLTYLANNHLDELKEKLDEESWLFLKHFRD